MDGRFKKLYASAAILFAALAVAVAVILLLVVVFQTMTIRLRTYFVFLGALIFFIFAVVVFTCKSVNSEKTKKILVRITMICAFAVYVALFLGFLFLIKAFSNQSPFVFAYNKEWLKNAIPGLIPFKETARDVYHAFTGRGSVAVVLMDILAHMMAFVPFAFFLPAFFKGMRRFDTFLPTIVFITIATELFQGMFSLGTCHIDDFILGAGTACLAFYILRRPRIIKYFNSRFIYF